MHFWDGFHLAVFYWSSCKTIDSGLTVSLPRVGPELTFLVLAELVNRQQDVPCRRTARGGALCDNDVTFQPPQSRAIKSRSITQVQKVAE